MIRVMNRSLRSWLSRVEITQEVDEEIAFHIEMRVRELVERGLDERVARELVLARGIQDRITRFRVSVLGSGFVFPGSGSRFRVHASRFRGAGTVNPEL